VGTELMEAEVAKARDRLGQWNSNVQGLNLVCGDFFGFSIDNEALKFDAIVGNPPFIRYQAFPEPLRSKAIHLMTLEGLTPNRLTNIWVPFVVASVRMLKPGGRLAFVLPAELLQVTYAGQLRSYLTDRFTSLHIVACNELFFPSAEQEVVLLLADGALPATNIRNRCSVRVTETKNVEELLASRPEDLLGEAQEKIVCHESEKWLKYFLTQTEIDLMREMKASQSVGTLGSHAEVDVGVVTGKNEFFVLAEAEVKALGLEAFTTRLVSRSAHLHGTRIGKADWEQLASLGDRVFLLDLAPFKGKEPKGSLAEYIAHGELNKVHEGYKCSIRKAWYEVPSVWAPEGFLFRQIYDFPRMVLNCAGATSTDTIHRVRCEEADPERVVANTYTWLTAASAEIEGRSYGGGVLELEPTEAERLLMPKVLNGAMPLAEADKLMRQGRLNDVLEENARIVLQGHMGLSERDCKVLAGVWEKMRDRRLNRRRKGVKPRVAKQ
ncbi:MAG: Eco57I restriction-modification methylase domain-containing protein, partial [Limisphaerales bacterium]